MPWPTAVICGSTRHPNALHAAAAEYTRRGYAVHMPHLAGATGELATQLADMWRHLIADAAMVVIVPKPDGTLGESTRAEMEWAELNGVPVETTAPAPMPGHVDGATR